MVILEQQQDELPVFILSREVKGIENLFWLSLMTW